MKQHRKFELKEYDPNWVNEFNQKSEKLKQIFGDQLLEIHHVGSTSIPDMVAKPQIDIIVVVKDFDKVKDYYKSMIKTGFTPRGTEYVGIGYEYFTEDTSDNKRLTSIHVFPQNNLIMKGILLFRDYLCSNKKDRDLYISVKKDLYNRYSNNYALYDSGKSDVIREIKKRADIWVKDKDVILEL